MNDLICFAHAAQFVVQIYFHMIVIGSASCVGHMRLPMTR
jgi:hypothetical protein